MIASHNSQIRATLGFPRRTFIARVPCIERAREPDVYEADIQRQATNCEFDYEAIYKSTSYFVHATVSCLESHCVEARETFRVRARMEIEQGPGENSLFNVVAYVTKRLSMALGL
jgi:hypothetical protein